MGKGREGYIKIYRKFLSSDIYKNDDAFRVFMHILLNACFSQTTLKNGVVLQRGEWAHSVRKIAEETQRTYQRTRSAILTLEKAQCLTHRVEGGCSVFSIVNYDSYQGNNARVNAGDNATTSKNQRTSQRQNNNVTNNNVTNKNVKQEGADAQTPPEEEKEDGNEWLTPDEWEARYGSI